MKCITCSSCYCLITVNLKNIKCKSCHSTFHLQSRCLKLENNEVLNLHDEIFLCYQCLENSLPFNSLDDVDYDIAINNLNNDLSQRECEKLRNLTFNPFGLNQSHNKRDHILDAVNPEVHYYNESNASSNYYLVNDFQQAVRTNHVSGNELSIFHLIVRSLRNKFDECLNYLHVLHFSFSIIALTETWLNYEHDNQDICIPGYHDIKLNRKAKSGGGVCLFVKER